jgi:hypothetical protein
LPIKNESLLLLRDVYQATKSNSKKYPITKLKRRLVDIYL